ncbi:phosphoribosylaminoimidazolesuccinocarboxamide synthase [Candidatus Gracilibacteria bacterium]|nr:phosphoribosylaminoimidazolesuccinocarboxamide synthase [Candidatus Gracilibacteria bacterium]
MKQNAIIGTNFQIPGLKKIHTGKVRDIYEIEGKNLLVVIATDRISAFDVVLPKGIPNKGMVLNKIAFHFLGEAEDHGICDTWRINKIHPMVTVGRKVKPFQIEMIVRGYLTGSLWREYKKGVRQVCGITLPDNMEEFEMFEVPIVTPTTKAESGHDQNISPEEIVAQGLATKEEYEEMENLAIELFDMGTELAAEKGLILVDTKYEFGKTDSGEIILIDEIHTPDSSRYWYEDGYMEAFEAGKAPRSLDKEFVRQWLMEQGFKGEEGQECPEMPDEFVQEVSARYLELYRKITGDGLIPGDYFIEEMENSIMQFMDDIE